MTEAVAMPALNPVVCVTGTAGWVEVTAAAELVAVEVCDIEDGEMRLENDLVVRGLVDVLAIELTLFEVIEIGVVEPFEVDVLELEDAIDLEVIGEAADVLEEAGTVLVLSKAVTPMVVCGTPFGMENVPSPLSQSQLPASSED